jgi:hypothetical protein
MERPKAVEFGTVSIRCAASPVTVIDSTPCALLDCACAVPNPANRPQTATVVINFNFNILPPLASDGANTPKLLSQAETQFAFYRILRNIFRTSVPTIVFALQHCPRKTPLT